MKRVTAIVFLLFANMFLLAHVAIPHHHHAEDEFCLVKHSYPSAESELPADTDHHNGSDSEACCAVGNLDALQPTTSKHNLTCSSHFYGYNNNTNHIQAILPDMAYSKFAATLNLPFRQKPLIVTSHNFFVSRIAGLRAPPFHA